MRCIKDYLVGSIIALVGFLLIMCGTGCFLMWDRDCILKDTLNIFQFAYVEAVNRSTQRVLNWPRARQQRRVSAPSDSNPNRGFHSCKFKSEATARNTSLRSVV